MNTISVLAIAELLEHPEDVSRLPAEVIPIALGALEQLKARLWHRLAVSQTVGPKETKKDQLLKADEASKKLGCSKDYLYRHAERLPFTVRVGRQLRFSEGGIEKCIHERMERKRNT